MAAGSGGGGGGGGGNTDQPDYGDQVVLYRYSDGFPVTSAAVCPEVLDVECTPDDAIGGLCLQPIASQMFDDCELTNPNLSGEVSACLVPVDPVTCAPKAGYESLLMEVEFGRINLVRSPEDVLEEQLQEALYSLTTAGCLSRDAAGRFVYSTQLSEGVVESHAIDSPLQNLAIFWKIMKDGELDNNVYIGETAYEVAMTAARGLGASSDKEGEITVDLLSYLNEILDFAKEGGNALFGYSCIDVRQEVQGLMEVVPKCYLEFDTFSYDRGNNFSFLPSPAYIPNSSGEVQDGWFEYLALDDSSLVVTQGPILEAVPELKAGQDLVAEGISGFIQAADDTRATIEFVHTWEVPEILATPVRCEVAASDWFDLSISEQSGLQVPKRMIVGAEDREVIVTVQNAGPAAASGCVYVDAHIDGVDGVVHYNENFCFSDDPDDLEPPLPAGLSYTWARFVPKVEIECTLYWKAEVVADLLLDETNPDVNSSNNMVEEITTVTSSGGGGGH